MKSLYGMATSALTPDNLSKEFYYNVDGLHVERSSQQLDEEGEETVEGSFRDFGVDAFLVEEESG
jgi:hypothetical protein